ncbi:MAG TPA: sodium-independent anion transporter, partial [Variovorax sp.]
LLAAVAKRGESLRLVIIDLSSSPYVDVAAAEMLAECHEGLGGRGIVLKVSNLNGEVRDLMRRDELEKVFGDIGPGQSVEAIMKRWKQAQGSST